jgi:hypothetical protein
MVSLQCELLYVNANEMVGKRTLYTGSRQMVSPRCELLHVSASFETFQRLLYTRSTQKVGWVYPKRKSQCVLEAAEWFFLT